MSLSEGQTYNLLLPDLKLTKFGEQEKQKHTSIQHKQVRIPPDARDTPQSIKSTRQLPWQEHKYQKHQDSMFSPRPLAL